MTINFNVPILGFGGLPMTEKVKDADGNEKAVVVKVSDMLGRLLFFAGQQGNNAQDASMMLTAEEKYAAFKLSIQLASHPDKVEMTTDDGTLIKRLAGKTYVAGIYGQIYDLVEQKDK